MRCYNWRIVDKITYLRFQVWSRQICVISCDKYRWANTKDQIWISKSPIGKLGIYSSAAAKIQKCFGYKQHNYVIKQGCRGHKRHNHVIKNYWASNAYRCWLGWEFIWSQYNLTLYLLLGILLACIIQIRSVVKCIGSGVTSMWYQFCVNKKLPSDLLGQRTLFRWFDF